MLVMHGAASLGPFPVWPGKAGFNGLTLGANVTPSQLTAPAMLSSMRCIMILASVRDLVTQDPHAATLAELI